MTMHRSRILALAAALAVSTPGAALAQAAAPEGKVPSVTYVLDKGVTSNRIATARMWDDLASDAQALRALVAAQNWTEAEAKTRQVRARIDAMQASKVVDRHARLLIAELRPFTIDLEERVRDRRTGVLRGVDTLLGHIARLQNELIAQGHMERLGGGAGRGLPRLPEVRIYPPGSGAEVIPPAPTSPETDREPPDTDPNRSVSPGNERNQIDENRFEED